MKSGLVNTLYLTIEPILFGNGMRLFKEDLDIKLELVNSEKKECGTVLTEYRVIQ
jgi:dihydrofolate reductase